MWRGRKQVHGDAQYCITGQTPANNESTAHKETRAKIKNSEKNMPARWTSAIYAGPALYMSSATSAGRLKGYCRNSCCKKVRRERRDRKRKRKRTRRKRKRKRIALVRYKEEYGAPIQRARWVCIPEEYRAGIGPEERASAV